MWSIACFLTPLLFLAGILYDRSAFPESRFLFPNTFEDSLLFQTIIERASQGYLGDSFLWEYRDDPAALTSFFNFWPVVFGVIYRQGGWPLLLCLSLFMSGLWFYSIFQMNRLLGQKEPYAFFMAGIQTFFVVNLAYQMMGFKTNFGLYNFWVTEHMRLYPSVTAMAIYNFSALLTLKALLRQNYLVALLAGVMTALTVYGRPFDWMVLIMGIGLLAGVAFYFRDSRWTSYCLTILITSIISSLPFLYGYFSYMSEYREAYMDQMMRGNLQVKLPLHYIKYGILCFLAVGLVWIANRRGFLLPFFPSSSSSHSLKTYRGTYWISALFATSLLAHFKTAFDGGATLVGFAYLMVFSAIPWAFMLGAQAFYTFTLKWVPHFSQKALWPLLLMILLIGQQVGGMTSLRERFPFAPIPSERMEVYSWLQKNAEKNHVLLSLSRGVEATVFADSWLYLPHPLVAAKTSPAPTSELLRRFLQSKLLLTGTVRDLLPLFSIHGLSEIRSWTATQTPQLQFWIQFLEESIGSNTFIFHPQKNQGELKLRKINLPNALVEQNDFVCYFTAEYGAVYNQCLAIEKRYSPQDFAFALRKRGQLDYIYIPRNAADLVGDISAFHPHWQKVGPHHSKGGLWKVYEPKNIPQPAVPLPPPLKETPKVP
jgi:hypothetical protein